MNKFSIPTLFLIVIFSLGMLFPGVRAFAGTGLKIQPIKISHTMEPGKEVEGFITLTNQSEDEEVEVQMSVEDFEPMAGTTNVRFVGRAQGVTTVRDWIHVDTPDSFLFRKGETKRVRYTITAPPNAEPGGHFGIIFFNALKIDDVSQLKVGTRVGILVFVTIPGNNLQKGEILDFGAPTFVQKPPVSFNIKFRNTGTVHFEPKGTITITNMFGKVVGEVPVEGQVVLPSGVRDIPVSWNVEGFLLGRYTANVKLFDGEGNELTAKSASFLVIPVWYALEFLGAVLILYLLFRFLKKKIKIKVSFGE